MTTNNQFFGTPLKTLAAQFLAGSKKERKAITDHVKGSAQRKQGKPQGRRWANAAAAMISGDEARIEAYAGLRSWDGIKTSAPAKPEELMSTFTSDESDPPKAAKGKTKAKTKAAPAKAAPAKPEPETKGRYATAQSVGALTKRMNGIDERLDNLTDQVSKTNSLLANWIDQNLTDDAA